LNEVFELPFLLVLAIIGVLYHHDDMEQELIWTTVENTEPFSGRNDDDVDQKKIPQKRICVLPKLIAMDVLWALLLYPPSPTVS
jgi:hypothetical protein